MTAPSPRALRVARFIDRHRWAVLGGALAVTVLAGWYAAKLPLHGDFSHLVPEDAPSVQQLRQLQARVANLGTLLVVVEGDDPARRAGAAEVMRRKLEGFDKALVSNVIFDDRVARQFVWDHRFLYADKADLLKARDALAEKIERGKLAANPLYVDLEDDGEKTAAAAQEESEKQLGAKLDDAEAKKDVVGRVSEDGRLQLIVVRTGFEAGSASQGRDLVEQTARAAGQIEKEYGVNIALAGDTIVGLAEHDALLAGMERSAILTVLIVAAGLMLFYRSVRAIGALFFALAVGVAMTFAFTRLAIGHLNMASGFLSSIVIGNGINFGILLLARHLEERRRGLVGVEAIAVAMAGTFTGTLAAALTAAVAYGSLAATTFRGFAHFGIIGGVGMILCWITAYTVLPAGLAVLERRRLRVRKAPSLGPLIARLLPRTHGGVAAIAGLALVVTAAAGVATYKYLENPYEQDWRNLRSTTARIEEAGAWQRRIDHAFGRHLSGGFIVAAPTREAARQVEARLREVSQERNAPAPLVTVVRSIDDVLPKDQPEKLAILADLRRMIDHESGRLSEEQRARLARLRPPEGITPIGDGDLPAAMAFPFTERDGTRGRILFADRPERLDTWISKDLLEFTSGVQGLDFPPGTALGGANFVFADVLRSLEADGPRSTIIAIAGAFLVIVLLIGFGRHGAVTLVCMSAGTLLMLAGAWLLGLRVNFLDFVALPITIGIGVDYSVNIVARARQGGDGQEGRVGAARSALATTGGAVALCSFTTIVGYGSLLVSPNQGIHSFGLAAILGELTCIVAALILAPTLLQLVAPRSSGPATNGATDAPPSRIG